MDRRLPLLAAQPTVSSKPANLPADLQAWADARRRQRLSHAHVQMARELGLNPRKLGKLDNHKAEPWKQPLPQFIEGLYVKRFGRERPEVVTSLEERAHQLLARAKSDRQAAARPRGRRQPGTRRHERVPVLRVPRDRPPAGRAAGAPSSAPSPRGRRSLRRASSTSTTGATSAAIPPQ